MTYLAEEKEKVMAQAVALDFHFVFSQYDY